MSPGSYRSPSAPSKTEGRPPKLLGTGTLLGPLVTTMSPGPLPTPRTQVLEVTNRKIDNRLNRRIKEHLDQDLFLTPHGLQRQIPELKTISKETIRRCIADEIGIPSRKAAVKPHMTSSQRIRRLDWAQRRRKWTQRRWRKILWSNETHIEMWRGFRHGLRVRRSSSISRYDPRFIRRSVKFPPKIMIWAAIGNGKVGRRGVSTSWRGTRR